MFARTLVLIGVLSVTLLGEEPAKNNVFTPRSYVGKPKELSLSAVLGADAPGTKQAPAPIPNPAICSIPLLEPKTQAAQIDPMSVPRRPVQIDPKGVVKPPVPACKNWNRAATSSGGSILH